MNTPNLSLSFRIGFVALLVLLLTYLSPQPVIFKYEYAEGKPWVYTDLIADFNFPIKKSEEYLQNEGEQVRRETLPYFVRDSSIPEMEIQKVRKRIPVIIELNKEVFHNTNVDSFHLTNISERVLNEIYSKGIIQGSLNELPMEPNGKLMLLDSQHLDLRTTSSFYNRESAITELLSAMEGRKFSGILLPLLENSLIPNILYNDSISKKVLEKNLAEISVNRGSVQQGELIIQTGDIVTKEKYRVLESLREEYSSKIIGIVQARLVSLGHLLINTLMFGLFLIYIAVFEQALFRNFRQLIFVFLLISGVSLSTTLIVNSSLPILYIFPFCIVPILLRMYFSATLAFLAHLSIVLISTFITSASYGFVFIQLVGGFVAIIANHNARYWSQFFRATLWLWMAYMLSYLGVSFVEGTDLQGLNINNFGWLSVSAILTMITYPLIPMIERILGFISPITLIELSDLNKPLLKKLSIEAPGTFQHSLQVANLAEAAAFELDANELLVRVGALYHDIGKLDNPEYFIENQQAEYNPHDEISYKESASIIIKHVTRGVEIAKKYKLPKPIIEFIRTHHGTSRVEYFYRSYIRSENETEKDEEQFRYPGPKPETIECAILMLADSVEAAARAIKNPDKEQLEALVDKIIRQKMDHNQLSDARLTFHDISVCVNIFKKMLNSIYHVRIPYPDDKEEDSIEKFG